MNAFIGRFTRCCLDNACSVAWCWCLRASSAQSYPCSTWLTAVCTHNIHRYNYTVAIAVKSKTRMWPSELCQVTLIDIPSRSFQVLRINGFISKHKHKHMVCISKYNICRHWLLSDCHLVYIVVFLSFSFLNCCVLPIFWWNKDVYNVRNHLQRSDVMCDQLFRRSYSTGRTVIMILSTTC